MELFLFIFITTALTSFSVSTVSRLRTFRDAADMGYRFNTAGIGMWLSTFTSINFLLSMLIPIYNLIITFYEVMDYEHAGENVLNWLLEYEGLEEFIDSEKQVYERKKTPLHAFGMALKIESRLNRASFIEFDDGSTIFFEYNKKLDNIIVLKAYGPANKLTIEQQKEIVIEFLKSEEQEELEKQDIDNHVNNSDLSNSLNIEKNDLISTSKSSVREQIQSLEEFKDELLEPKTTIDEKHNQLGKKRKK